MTYITGVHALNLPCQLDTCGDWHASALKWEDISSAETANSPLGEYGIEKGHVIPFHEGTYNVANHIRACLDLLADGNFTKVQGMKRDLIGNDKYTNEIFYMVGKLRSSPHWPEIDRFMGKEYLLKWENYARRLTGHGS